MPKFIRKNGDYFLRKPYDFALHPEGAQLLFTQNIEINQSIDDEYFKVLCNKNYVAFFPSDLSGSSSDPDPAESAEVKNEESCDSLGELMDSIRKIEQRFSLYGIEIEVRVKPSKPN